MVYKISFVFLCALAATSCQRIDPRLRLTEYDDDSFVIGDEIPGEPGIDYPVLDSIPETGFTCDDYGYPGYYADPLAGCQAYYRCHKSGRGVATLCPNGTIFNQETLVCDWWYNFDCSLAVEFYDRNIEVVEAMAIVDANNDLLRKEDTRPRGLAQTPLRRQGLATNIPSRNRALASRLVAAGRLPVTSNFGRLPITSNLGRLPIVSSYGRRPLTSNFGRLSQSGARRPSFTGQSTVRPSSDRYNNNYKNYNNNNNNNNNNYDNERNTKSNYDNERDTKSNNYNNNRNNKQNNNNESQNEINDDVEFNGYDANGNEISRGYLPPSK